MHLKATAKHGAPRCSSSGGRRLDGSEPAVRVRRGIVRGRVEPPKSRHGRRDVPLDSSLVHELRERRRLTEWARDEDLVFPSLGGTPLNPENLRRRVLRPAAEEADAPWVGFHTFRHTCAASEEVLKSRAPEVDEARPRAARTRSHSLGGLANVEVRRGGK